MKYDKHTPPPVGTCFVKGDSLRQVMQYRPDGDIYWQSWSATTGEPQDSLVCSVRRMFSWSERYATPEEMARRKPWRSDALDCLVSDLRAVKETYPEQWAALMRRLGLADDEPPKRKRKK